VHKPHGLASLAERERLRQKTLLDQGVVPQQSYDAAATQARTSREALLELQRGNRPEDIASAKATLEAEEKQLGYLERQRAESAVKAPAAGVIESMELRPGDLVGPNQPVARILEPGQIWVRVYVPEPQLGRVRVGQRAAIRWTPGPTASSPGRSSRSARSPSTRRATSRRSTSAADQVFGVKVAIDPAPELKPGMSATVRVVE
jgi:multidrug resistance efflux pump